LANAPPLRPPLPFLQAFSLGAEELQLQAWGRTSTELFSCGVDLFELDARVVVTLPATLDGLKAARELINNGVPVTLTGACAACGRRRRRRAPRRWRQ
jgi:transaldolase